MKACVLEAVNKLEYKDVPTPTPAAGEVLLRIKASGICSSDFSRVFKTGTYYFPTIPGHEFAGEIVQVGEGVDAALTFAGQPMVPFAMQKAKRLKEYLESQGLQDKEIEVDGNITFDNARKLREIGASIFVAGTSSIFGSQGIKSGSIEEISELPSNKAISPYASQKPLLQEGLLGSVIKFRCLA